MTGLREAAGDRALDPAERVARIAAYLRSKPDGGIEELVELFIAADDADDARPYADCLGLLPGLRPHKDRVVRYALDERRDKLAVVTLPLKSVSEEVVVDVVEAYLDAPEDDGLADLAYEVGLYFPYLLRPHRDRIDDQLLSMALLAGAENDITEQLEAAYRDDLDPETLRKLAVIRTDRARAALIALRDEAPEHEIDTFDLYLEVAGVSPDTREPSVYPKTFDCYVVAREDSPHHMGEGWEGPRPACPVCSTPSTRLVSLAADHLPFELSADPSFFWFSCECGALDATVVHFTPAGVEGLMTPMTDGQPEHPIVPGATSLHLERHPNQHGYAIEVTGGFGSHQVGGYTPWRDLARHPHCPLCAKAMRFLVAIDSGPTPFGPMGFDGLLYGFWCDRDAVSCTIQQRLELV
jgi:hypothetical protein